MIRKLVATDNDNATTIVRFELGLIFSLITPGRCWVGLADTVLYELGAFSLAS